LINAGVRADLFTRNTAHIEALKKDGANISGTLSFSTPPFDGEGMHGGAFTPTEIRKQYDIIILLTKQQENAATAFFLKKYLGPRGVVCTLQNGLPEPGLAAVLGEDRVLGCIAAWGASMASPGAATLTSEKGSMSFGLGSLCGAGPNGKEHPMIDPARKILEKMCPVTVEPNFIGVRWSKLLINAAFSGMSAMTGFTFGEVAANRRSRNAALQVIKECIAVCRAAGVKIEPVQGKDIVRLMSFNNPLQKLRASIILPIAIRKHRAITSGMLKDLDKGRASEIDAINGVVSTWGRQHTVPTPCNDRIVEIVHSIERGERKYSPANLALMQ
jgi:2-dehydropantoate 2-reductase